MMLCGFGQSRNRTSRFSLEASGILTWRASSNGSASRWTRFGSSIKWRDDGLIGGESSFLAVIVGEDICAGCVEWRPIGPFGNYEMGVLLFPEHRHDRTGGERQLIALPLCDHDGAPNPSGHGS